MRAIVELEQVSKIYGEGSAAVHALREVSLVIEAGELSVVAGPSGSGKSTLLNIISGLDRVTRGTVRFDGVDMTHARPSALSKLRLRRVGFVFQAYNLLPVLTAYENAEYVLMLQGVPARERRERVMRVLSEVGLAGLEHRFPRELSGGQQQRVAIARAIVAEPGLVLADEPTANLDSKTGGSLIDLMQRLNEEKGVTFLFSSHDPHIISRARRLIRIKDGEIESEGSHAAQLA